MGEGGGQTLGGGGSLTLWGSRSHPGNYHRQQNHLRSETSKIGVLRLASWELGFYPVWVLGEFRSPYTGAKPKPNTG